jgi:two-component system, NtrC family, C4-dicarboxylate transport response regulator DctD
MTTQKSIQNVRIILVDDDDSIRSGLSFAFSKKRVPMEAFATAELALDYLDKHDADLVITDFSLPGLNGLEFIRTLNGLQPDLGKILITGHATLDMAVEAIKLGVHVFIEKPLRTNTIESAIERAMTGFQGKLECTRLHGCPAMRSVQPEPDRAPAPDEAAFTPAGRGYRSHGGSVPGESVKPSGKRP